MASHNNIKQITRIIITLTISVKFCNFAWTRTLNVADEGQLRSSWQQFFAATAFLKSSMSQFLISTDPFLAGFRKKLTIKIVLENVINILCTVLWVQILGECLTLEKKKKKEVLGRTRMDPGQIMEVILGQLDITGRLVRHLCSERKVNIIIISWRTGIISLQFGKFLHIVKLWSIFVK